MDGGVGLKGRDPLYPRVALAAPSPPWELVQFGDTIRGQGAGAMLFSAAEHPFAHVEAVGAR